MPKQHSDEHEQHGHEPEPKDRSEFLSKTGEKAEEYAKEYFTKDKKEGGHAEDHCKACHHRVTQTEKMVKTTLIVSILAFLLSSVSMAVPFLKDKEVQFSSKEWEQFLTTLEESLKTPEPASPPAEPSAQIPVAPAHRSSKAVVTTPKSSAAAVAVSSSAAAVAVSSRPKSSVAVIASSSRVATGGGVRSSIPQVIESSSQASSEQIVASSQASSEPAQQSSAAESSIKEQSSAPADGTGGGAVDPTL